jgi:hypothetical protein
MSGGSRTNTASSGTSNNFTRVGPNPFVSSLIPTGSTEAFSALRGAEDPITQRSRELLEGTIGGDFVSGQNPALEAVFNRGADAITQRLQGDFSRAGRNIGAARPVAADELGSFRAQLDLGNLARERPLQQAAIAQGQQLNPVDQFLRRLGILSDAGGREVQTQGSFTGSDTTREKQSVLDRVLGIAGLF